jgi:ADP-heptose:LPS heptosyltransferase
MRIAASFANGIGNFVIFTSILQALKYHSGNNVTLVLDDEWQGESRNGIELIAGNLPFVDKVISYQDEYCDSDYDYLHMSAHSIMSISIYRDLFGDKPDPDQYTSWATSFLSELDYYYLELYRKLEYRGPIFSQYWPSYSDFVKSPFLYKLRTIEETKIIVSNGYRRSPENRMASKAYPHWGEVMSKVKELHEDVKFILVGGQDDKEWAREITKLFSEKDCFNFVGKSNLLETGAIIGMGDLILSTDTGVAHVADAMRVPGIMVFASTLYSKNYPINGTIIPIRSMLTCSPCQSTILFSMCGENERCAEAISPKYIVSVVRKLLQGDIDAKS